MHEEIYALQKSVQMHEENCALQNFVHYYDLIFFLFLPVLVLIKQLLYPFTLKNFRLIVEGLCI